MSRSITSSSLSMTFACAVVLGAAEPRLRLGLLVLAALVAWSRVDVGVHYPLDVLAGAILGVAVGVSVRALQQRAAGLRRSPRSTRAG